jgi:hypothetical protein
VRPLVKRARSAEIGTLAFEVHVLADDLHNVGGVANLLDSFVGNHFDSTTRSLNQSRDTLDFLVRLTTMAGIISDPPR